MQDRLKHILLLLFLTFIVAMLAYAYIKTEHTKLELQQIPEVVTELHASPYSRLVGEVYEKVEHINPVNMYIDVSEETGEVTSVILGSLMKRKNQYAFAIKKDNNEVYYHNLPLGIEDVKIVGVSNSQYYFLQNKEGNEYVFKLNIENPLEQIDFVKSCPKRCE